jgi:hypothetical protein
MAIEKLKINQITQVPTYEEPDPYKIIQVHDFRGFKFFPWKHWHFRAKWSIVAKGFRMFSNFYPGLWGQVEFVGLGGAWDILSQPFLKKSSGKCKRWHSVREPSSLAEKWLPETVGMYPSEYGGQDPSFSVCAGDHPPIVCCSDLEDSDSEEPRIPKPFHIPHPSRIPWRRRTGHGASRRNASGVFGRMTNLFGRCPVLPNMAALGMSQPNLMNPLGSGAAATAASQESLGNYPDISQENPVRTGTDPVQDPT